jgi:5'-AMP-activated protein kinase catalytic alpha subunit
VMKPQVPGYSIGKSLGRGAFANVWLAVEKKSGHRLACKCIPKSGYLNADGYKNIKNEIEALKSLAHPNIIKLVSLYETSESFCVFMELCEEGTLEELIVKKKSLPENLAQKIFKQIISALEYCHLKGFAHRDLKPSNILIHSLPEIRVSDFGVSGTISGSGLMSTICGTIYYSAPECMDGQYNGPAADMWSCGIVLYSMLKGNIPWRSRMQGDLIAEMEKGVPEIPGVSYEVNQLIKRLSNIDPMLRPSASEVLRDPWFSINPSNTKVITPPPSRGIKTTAALLRQLTEGSKEREKHKPHNEPKRRLSMSFELY